MAYQLERDQNVISYVKNDHLDFEIPYEFSEVMRARIRNVASYALCSLLRLVLNREAAENIRGPDKAVSPTYFNT